MAASAFLRFRDDCDDTHPAAGEEEEEVVAGFCDQRQVRRRETWAVSRLADAPSPVQASKNVPSQLAASFFDMPNKLLRCGLT